MKKKTTKTECIMNALKAGQKISALTAWRMCRTFTLAEIIRNLRKKYGMNIVTEWATDNGCRFAVYSLARKRSK